MIKIHYTLPLKRSEYAFQIKSTVTNKISSLFLGIHYGVQFLLKGDLKKRKISLSCFEKNASFFSALFQCCLGILNPKVAHSIDKNQANNTFSQWVLKHTPSFFTNKRIFLLTAKPLIKITDLFLGSLFAPICFLSFGSFLAQKTYSHLLSGGSVIFFIANDILNPQTKEQYPCDTPSLRKEKNKKLDVQDTIKNFFNQTDKITYVKDLIDQTMCSNSQEQDLLLFRFFNHNDVSRFVFEKKFNTQTFCYQDINFINKKTILDYLVDKLIEKRKDCISFLITGFREQLKNENDNKKLLRKNHFVGKVMYLYFKKKKLIQKTNLLTEFYKTLLENTKEFQKSLDKNETLKSKLHSLSSNLCSKNPEKLSTLQKQFKNAVYNTEKELYLFLQKTFKSKDPTIQELKTFLNKLNVLIASKKLTNPQLFTLSSILFLRLLMPPLMKQCNLSNKTNAYYLLKPIMTKQNTGKYYSQLKSPELQFLKENEDNNKIYNNLLTTIFNLQNLNNQT